ncbi:hypothetical protein PAXINDRAFT_15989 [Paxillus involutus ATCC 200175]|uniref:DUF6533 domain-containing protein n=1 Tax=Paxillus involutus ATCC 200175 TaxID=664439 RepID=A0A0C9TTB3_PAXIN|nr:hypothetical protein PAXINDRAFT_15989 [Paxillus involutus ATCC 200175]
MSTNSPSPDTSNTPSGTARTLLNYGTVSVLAIWLYEYAVTFDDEITFLRDSRWSSVKILYLVCRYLMFPFVITNTFLIFLARTYALWNRRKAALIIIVVNFTVHIQNDEASCCDLPCLQSEVFIIPTIVILALFGSAITMIPFSGITSCDDVSQRRVLVWVYVLLVIGETEILLSTVYQAVRYYREVGAGNRLLAILVQHNTFYFCCSLASSATAIVTIYFIMVRPVRRLDSQLTGNPTWNTGYSDAPFAVEFGPKEEKSVKSE